MQVFRSVYHPGRAPLALVLARAQAGPLAVALVAVMLGGVAGALQQLPLTDLLWALPLAYGSALLWTAFSLTRTPAEFMIDGALGAVRSVWAVARRAGPDDPLAPVFAPRKIDGVLHVGVGDVTYALRPTEWPAFAALVSAVDAASSWTQTAVIADA